MDKLKIIYNNIQKYADKIFKIIIKILKFLFIEEADENNSSIYNTIKNIFIALIIALIIRSILYEPFHIPSGSMKPNLLEGDYIFVSKYDYGYSRYSFPFGFPLFKNRIFFNKTPKRGEVLVFRLPTNPKINYIKRFIGLPGDKVQMKNGILYINDEAVDKKYIGEGLEYEDIDSKIAIYEETIDNVVFNTFDRIDDSDGDNTPIFYVPEKHYFFMGDNRDNSLDSRFIATGFVPEENIIGKAKIIFLSSKENPFKFWKWHKIIRKDRLFKKIN